MPDLPELFDAAAKRGFRQRLRPWYDRVARDLPWRRTRDPYAIWVSETMLQQTTVAAVVPFYERFLKRFPTVADLAAASEHEVLQLWEGLGYYSRARNLHAAAQVIRDQHGGEFPRDVETLRTLPGVGRYTAGAVASFAFDVRAPIVEANTLRLYSRLLGLRDDPKSSAAQRLLWQFAEDVLPRSEPGRFNHALMDLGATVCRPVAPDCPNCPVRANCRAFAAGLQLEIPRPAPRPTITERTDVSIAVVRDGRYLLRRRGPGEWWAGLWDFPRFSLTDAEAATAVVGSTRNVRSAPPLPGLSALPRETRQRLQHETREQTGVDAELGELLTAFRHGVTRYRISLLCFRADYRSGEPRTGGEVRWVAPHEFTDHALSTTGRKLARLLAAG